MSKYVHYEKRYVSLARRLWDESQSEADLRRCYGDGASPDGVGCNLTLILGSKSEGAKVSRALDQLCELIDHRFLNEHILHFDNQPPTFENILLWLLKELGDIDMQSLRIEDSGVQAVTWENGKLHYSRHYQVRCVHRHHNPDLSEEENLKLYSKCAGLHGHDYQLEVFVSGEIHPTSGVLIEREAMDEWVQKEIITPFDKTYLNKSIGNTSGELILEAFHSRLRSSSPQFSMLCVRETQKNSFFIK